MKASCEIVIDFGDPEKVKTVLKSVKVDDFDFVKSKANGKKLEASIKAESVSSLLHTLDDYLACISVAGKVLDKH
jgi:tRNA threonylcarbamoyladenosine modification (KEOPS) complex  Pcc1 subunit